MIAHFHGLTKCLSTQVKLSPGVTKSPVVLRSHCFVFSIPSTINGLSMTHPTCKYEKEMLLKTECHHILLSTIYGKFEHNKRVNKKVAYFGSVFLTTIIILTSTLSNTIP